MSVQLTQSYKDARAPVFHSSVVKRQVAYDGPFVGTYHASPSVAAIAGKKQLTPAARAATAASWVGKLTMLEVYDAAETCKADAAQSPLLLCDWESSAASTVMTDNDIDDECGSPASVCTAETASPLQVFGQLRKHPHARMPLSDRVTFAAHEQEDDEMSVTTELEDDLTVAATLLCKDTKKLMQQNCAGDDRESNGILRSTNSSETSANLDRFDEEKERPSRAVKGITSWLNQHVSPHAVEEEVPEEIF